MKKWWIGILSILIMGMILTGCSGQPEQTIKHEQVDENVTEEVTEELSSQTLPAEEGNVAEQEETTTGVQDNKQTAQMAAGVGGGQPDDLLQNRDERGQGDIFDRVQSDERSNEEQNNIQQLKKYYYSPFSGKPVKNKILQRAVMVSIENSPQSRPQSGLEMAPIVYEFLVEGGITRFLALYWNQLPDKIGPIRSVRPYMIDLALEYNALLLHAGASTEGFAMLEDKNVASLDQIYRGNYYWRGNDRKMPHNLYTGDFKINSYLDSLTGQEYGKRFLFQQASFLNPEDEKAEKITIDYWGNYQVNYHFDPAENDYNRYLFDFETPHLTADGVQLTAKNIIVQYVQTRVKDDEGRLEMEIYGQGDLLLFRDGIVIKGFWKKEEEEDFTQFFTQAGEQLAVNPGQTWIQIVPESTDIHYEEEDGYNE